MLENPVTSRLWLEKDVQDLWELPGVEEAICHSGAYGGVNSKGQPIRKTFRFLGNCPLVLQQLRCRLSAEELKECVPLEGKETTLSQHYPDNMVLAILKGISDTVKHEQRRLPATTAFKVHAVTDVNAWQQVFQSAEHLQHLQRQQLCDSQLRPTLEDGGRAHRLGEDGEDPIESSTDYLEIPISPAAHSSRRSLVVQ